jgi:imidazolonepropionase
MSQLITNIKGLVNVREEVQLLRGAALAHLHVIENAWLLIEDDTIHSYGSMNDLPFHPSSFAAHYDAAGAYVLPSWCDSHTHLVFSGSRES